jgi:acyl-homoserine lactone acylase PvdQ
MLAPGNSGQVASPHYNDLTGKWLKGEFKKMGWGLIEGKDLTLRP